MKLYNISLTITDEDNNEQLVSLRAPHLTGLQISDLITMVTGGIMVEPEPEIVLVSKPKKKHRFGRQYKPNEIVNIDLEEIDGIK